MDIENDPFDRREIRRTDWLAKPSDFGEAGFMQRHAWANWAVLFLAGVLMLALGSIGNLWLP